MQHETEAFWRFLFVFLFLEKSLNKMYAATISIVKGSNHQLFSRMCIQGVPKLQKFCCDKSPVERLQEKEKWWKTGVKNVFGKYLLLTNTVSSGVLMAVGDLVEQELEHLGNGKYENSFDWTRNMHVGIVGTFQGPFNHFFYKLLDKHIPGVKLTSIAKKIFIDQMIASPTCIVIFFLGVNYLNKEDFEVSITELKQKFWYVYAADCAIWIPAQFINFYCLSTKYRVIYVNLVTMCYNVFLSFMKHAKFSI